MTAAEKLPGPDTVPAPAQDAAPPAVPKSTSYAYGEGYQARQIEKFHGRRTNHWRHRLELCERLMQAYVLPRFAGTPAAAMTVADVGCSIGTFAIEYAGKGYRAYGIDFDPVALEHARALSAAEGIAPEFFCGDVARWPEAFPKIDVALCFDIFEHLHDDELGGMLKGIAQNLSPRGCILFHTFPTELEHVFYNNRAIMLPLAALAWLPAHAFHRAALAYGAIVDAALCLATGQNWRERIKKRPHCNLLSETRLRDILERMGYDVLFIGTENLYPFHAGRMRWFRRHKLSHRNLFGVAAPKVRA